MLLAGRLGDAPRGSWGGRGGAPLGIGFLVLLSSAVGWGGQVLCTSTKGILGVLGSLAEAMPVNPFLAMFMPPTGVGILTCPSGGEQC